jgi:hypothetical protein
LSSENHQKKLLIRVIRELLGKGPYFHNLLLVQEVNDDAEVARVPTQAIRRPGENGIEFF